MTGFDLFAAESDAELESFRCIVCDIKFIGPSDALEHLHEHLNEIEDFEETEDSSAEPVAEPEFDPGELSRWTNSKIMTSAYEEWIAEFGYAECISCPERFNSKISWLHHIIMDHKIDPGKKYLFDDCKLDINDGIPVSTNDLKALGKKILNRLNSSLINTMIFQFLQVVKICPIATLALQVQL